MVKVAGVKPAVPEDDVMEGILYDRFFLVIIKPGKQDHP